MAVQVPVVIRGPGGVGRQLGAEHSQRLESYFQSIPGVQLVACSTTANAKALLKSAIRSDNPIIFFEHVLLYNVKGAYPWKSAGSQVSLLGEEPPSEREVYRRTAHRNGAISVLKGGGGGAYQLL